MAAKTIDNRLDEIARIRARFLVLDREVDECQRAPLTRAECEQRIDDVMTRAAASLNLGQLGQLLISPQRSGSIDLAGAVGVLLAGEIGTKANAAPAGALLAAAAPDQLREWLLSVAAETAADQQPPLSATDRAERLKLLEDERTDLEKAEAEALWIIEDLGQLAPWRGDQDPALVLGLDP